MNKEKFFDFSLSELEKYFVDFGLPKYRAKQIFSWVYKNNIYNFQLMTNLSLDLRKYLESQFDISFLLTKNVAQSKDMSMKFLFDLGNSEFIESVYIKHSNRNTICVSSQIGCPVGCTMCSTGRIGFKRNLKASEIVLQVLSVESVIKPKFGKIDNIVFMGMGEPMLNFDNVIKAIKILTDKSGRSMSPRRIVISTSGYVDGIKKLKDVNLPIKLAVSLHATTDEIRTNLIPVNNIFNIEMLLNAAEEYALSSKRRVTFEYILMDDINDSDQDIIRLKDLLKGRHAHVNLIKYNQSNSNVTIKSKVQRIKVFEESLNNFGIKTTIRISKGEDINGACGQLALLTERLIKENIVEDD